MTAAGTPSTARPMDGPLLSRLYQMGIVKRDGEIKGEHHGYTDSDHTCIEFTEKKRAA